MSISEFYQIFRKPRTIQKIVANVNNSGCEKWKIRGCPRKVKSIYRQVKDDLHSYPLNKLSLIKE